MVDVVAVVSTTPPSPARELAYEPRVLFDDEEVVAETHSRWGSKAR